MRIDPELSRMLEEIAGDRVSGASVLLARTLTLLVAARRNGERAVRAVGDRLAAAHPSMASIRNAILLAEGADAPFEEFAARAARASRSLARVAAGLLGPGGEPGEPLRIVTCSASGSVAVCIETLARVRPVAVACAESRPLLEGRLMAERLAAARIDVELFTDAAIQSRIGPASVVLVGADAIADAWFINKAGTRPLVAIAGALGAPAYVVASKDKFAHPSTAGRLELVEGPSTEVFDAPPPGVVPRNPYFERIPLEALAALITDLGVLGPGDAAAVCLAMPRALPEGRDLGKI